MSDLLNLERARDLTGRGYEIWLRRALMLCFAAVPVLGLLNVFGQKATVATVSGPTASLTVRSPEHLRGGLLYEVRFIVHATSQLNNATLDLGGGWARGITVNTIEPSPTNETSDNGDLQFQLGTIKAGATYELHMDFQVNPTTVGGRDQQVALLVGDAIVLHLKRHLTVYP